MKFGHTIETECEALPPDLREHVLSYKAMKKLLKKIVKDMESRGLSPDILRALLLERTEGDPVAHAAAEHVTARDIADALHRTAHRRRASRASSISSFVASTATDDEGTVSESDAAAADSAAARRRGSHASTSSSTHTVIAPSHEETAPAAPVLTPIITYESTSMADLGTPTASAAVPSRLAPPAPGLHRRVSTVSLSKVSYVISATRNTSPGAAAAAGADAEHDSAISSDEEGSDRAATASTASAPSVTSTSPSTTATAAAPSSAAAPAADTPTPSPSPSPSASQAFGSQLVIVVDDSTRALCEPLLASKDCRVGPDGTCTVPLPSDADFFSYLSTALTSVSDFQQHHIARHFHDDLNELVRLVGDLTRVECRDHKIWRGIIKAYLESDMFLTVTQKPRSLEEVTDIMVRFQAAVAQALATPGFQYDNLSVHAIPKLGAESPASPAAAAAVPGTVAPPAPQKKPPVWNVIRWLHRGPSAGFKDKRSLPVFTHFMRMNTNMLGLSRFVQLNDTAVRKILKKHDKKTLLPSRDAWQRLDAGQQFLQSRGHAFTRVLLGELNLTLENITPLLDTYACPVCFGLMYPPVRLPTCSHAMCYPCAHHLTMMAAVPTPRELPETVPPTALSLPARVFLMRYPRAATKATLHCPLCRADTGITHNNADEMLVRGEDLAMTRLLKTHFPDEVRAKRKEYAAQCAQEDAEMMSLITLR
ncbi:hypothetical protein H9P43_005495 [Blastocladiella emersonii ATCC 22665]|nr:hypothetical protein H9P43_005495 [Blastocladiella emersonii ATCC 22665]